MWSTSFQEIPLPLLWPISAPSADEEDTSEVRGWSNSYFCTALNSRRLQLKPSSRLTSDLFISCQKFHPKLHVLGWLCSVCVKIYEWTSGPSWQSFLTRRRVCVCVDGTSCQKMCDFPCSHSWAVECFGKTPFTTGNAWRKHCHAK